jgi:hypothetical protein
MTTRNATPATVVPKNPAASAGAGRDEDERLRARIRLGRNRSQHRVEGRHHSPVGNRRKCLVTRRATSAAAGETPVAIPRRSV